jgi:thioredoxin 1
VRVPLAEPLEGGLPLPQSQDVALESVVIRFVRERCEHGAILGKEFWASVVEEFETLRHHRKRKEAMALDVTTTTFDEEVLQSDKPVLVDFWAEWCGPCHAVAPVLDRIAAEREDELKLVKVNIDQEHELQQRYGVASIPTLILFRDGEPSAAVIGAQPKGAIERSLGLVAA